MKILIIEDEAIAQERIKAMLREQVPDADLLGICDSVEDSVTYLTTHPMPDLMLMDIELTDGQSFEIFEEVKISCPVIFTTAYDEFVLRAFSVHSIDYLLKPIQVAELKKSIEKFRELKQVFASKASFTANDLLEELRSAMSPAAAAPREHFLVKQGQRLISISASEIAYFWSQDRYTYLKTYEDKFYLIENTLEEIEKQVDAKTFFRAGRKFLVERRSIQNVLIYFNGKLKVILHPNPKEDVIVSRDRAPEFKKWLGG